MIVTQPDRVLLKRQIALFASRLTSNLLDVGSADGNRYRHLLTKVTHIKTLDIDSKHKPDIVGSTESIPLENNTIDSILCTQVLEHVSHPQVAVTEMYRVLKPGGTALITVPQYNELHAEPNDFFRYTCFGLKNMCKKAGFDVIECDQRGGYHSCRAQMQIRYWIDRYSPYKRKLPMLFIGPVSIALTHYAIWRDRIDKTKACKKHAIGWAILLQKSA